jgi:hypothetical protein
MAIISQLARIYVVFPISYVIIDRIYPEFLFIFDRFISMAGTEKVARFSFDLNILLTSCFQFFILIRISVSVRIH